jgi:hypothetical protein
MNETPYSLDEVLGVFHYYFQKYEDTFGRVHPNISVKQIKRFIDAMPFIEDESDMINVLPEDYRVLIDKHFQTRYRNCDYNINHFFSGQIRRLRLLEEFC